MRPGLLLSWRALMTCSYWRSSPAEGTLRQGSPHWLEVHRLTMVKRAPCERRADGWRRPRPGLARFAVWAVLSMPWRLVVSARSSFHARAGGFPQSGAPSRACPCLGHGHDESELASWHAWNSGRLRPHLRAGLRPAGDSRGRAMRRPVVDCNWALLAGKSRVFLKLSPVRHRRANAGADERSRNPLSKWAGGGDLLPAAGCIGQGGRQGRGPGEGGGLVCPPVPLRRARGTHVTPGQASWGSARSRFVKPSSSASRWRFFARPR